MARKEIKAGTDPAQVAVIMMSLIEGAIFTLGAQRVEFRTDERNGKSRRAIEKLGASFEGILLKHMLLYDGHFRNTVYYSLLKEEWEM